MVRDPNEVRCVMPQYEMCLSCRGSGLQNGIEGPTDCYECDGNCVVIARDGKGRFTKTTTKGLSTNETFNSR